MSRTNPANEYEALAYVIERLVTRFPGVDEDEITVMAAEELESFDAARLRDYIPLLIEHGVRQRIQVHLAA
ncbi:three-helix bundle dimerization domain-containing protein [Microbacterium thalassium]|uniref:Uncharacterized protein n=1 Tax=Microbacterium thalassium TaxID=362649 RepID=A0A7X0FSD2_9MICO|nr:hypothetical protein [Microbacterium thalassium]MBB6392848.1 hypothetical protein [Microbacterium thalassium]GLK22921.1 hypothetical protein GCM10017607_02390 [Microbacterium thalassium]